MLAKAFTSLSQALLTLLLVSGIVFAVVSMSGDPVSLIVAGTPDRELAEQLREDLGLEQPLIVRYGQWLGQVVQGDLGFSRSRGQEVTTLIAQRLPRSLLLAGLSLAIATIIAVPAGVYSAVRRGGVGDRVVRAVAVVGQAAPAFWVGALLILLFSVRLGWLPVLSIGGTARPSAWILPSVTLAGFLTVAMLRLIRSGMLEVLDDEYVKLARLKGASEMRVVWRHAFRNALLPVLTFTAQYIGLIVTVAIVVEKVFAWPGMGLLGFEAILNRDLVLIQGFVLVSAGLVVLVNLAVDLLYARLDPRAR